jgi:hypothetical protein
MPLRSDFGDINRVLGCTSGEGDLFVPPVQFMISDVAVSPIEANQNITTDLPQPLPGFAEEQATFGGPPKTQPKLVTIEGNPDAPSRPREGGPKLRIID